MANPATYEVQQQRQPQYTSTPDDLGFVSIARSPGQHIFLSDRGPSPNDRSLYLNLKAGLVDCRQRRGALADILSSMDQLLTISCLLLPSN